jgi:4'-phosphopantetheinyl transferase
LNSREVDVWAAGLECSAQSLAALQATLSRDEQERAGRFYFERDRRRFICARGALRGLLGAYLNVEPGDLTFKYGEHGKPALSDKFDGALAFNLSHSHELALVVIGRGIEMGVDVEAIRPVADADDIASKFFSAAEVAALQALSESARRPAFFACWTRKEAYLKALGSGLARPLDQFSVSLIPGEPVRLVVHDDEGETARWSIRELAPEPGYAAALVTDGRPAKVRCWRWTDTTLVPAACGCVQTMEAV